MSGHPQAITTARDEMPLPKHLNDAPQEKQLAFVVRKISQLNFLSWFSFGLSALLILSLAVAHLGKNANPNASLAVDIVIAVAPLLAATGIRRILRRYKATESRIRHESTLQDLS